MNPIVKSFYLSELTRLLNKLKGHIPAFIIDLVKYLLSPLCVVIGSPYLITRKKEAYSQKKGIAIVAIAKNEADYIAEWCAFHKVVGVDAIIIYDNESDDNMKSYIMPFIKDGFVKYNTIRGKTKQSEAYNLAIKDYGSDYKYLAFIDCDEFLFTVNDNENLFDVVDGIFNNDYNVGGVAVNWCVFGSSGNVTKPEGGVIENYLWRADLPGGGNACVKSIIRPETVLMFNNPHYPIYKRGYIAIDTTGKYVESWENKIYEYKGLRINHYFTKSKEEWIKRRSIGRADISSVRSIEEFFEHDKNEVEDRSALSYKKEVDEILTNLKNNE